MGRVGVVVGFGGCYGCGVGIIGEVVVVVGGMWLGLW